MTLAFKRGFLLLPSRVQLGFFSHKIFGFTNHFCRAGYARILHFFPENKVIEFRVIGGFLIGYI